MSAVRTLGAERDHDQFRAIAENSIRGLLVIEPRAQPRQVVLAGFDNGALRGNEEQPFPVVGIIDQPDPDIGVNHHETTAALAGDQINKRGRYRLKHQSQRSNMNRIHIISELSRKHAFGEIWR